MAEFTRTPSHSVVDLTLDAFAHDEAQLRAALRDREADFVAYRELAQEAIQQLAIETARRRHYQRRYYALLNDQRQQGGAR